MSVQYLSGKNVRDRLGCPAVSCSLRIEHGSDEFDPD